MNIQSISIVVPTRGCVNKCKFCVSSMHESPYENHFSTTQIEKRIKFAVNNGVNTCIITGSGEALQNTKFLFALVDIFNEMDHPFPNVELQTSGVLLQKEGPTGYGWSIGKPWENYPNIELLRALRVNTISLSVSDIFDSENNWDIIRAPKNMRPSLVDLTNFIKEMGFNLRLSLNMTSAYNEKSAKEILEGCKFLGADQITFRKLYHSDDDSPQTQWVKSNAVKPWVLEKLHLYIAGSTSNGKINTDGHGTPLYRLPFGPMAYSINGMSTVVDDNCMNKESYDQLKYVILRENGKLYCQWDDEGSLIF